MRNASADPAQATPAAPTLRSGCGPGRSFSQGPCDDAVRTPVAVRSVRQQGRIDPSALAHAAEGELAFLDVLVRFDDAGFGNRDDEPASGGTVLRLLTQHLAGEVPGEQRHQVRPAFGQAIGWDDGYLLAGRELAWFVGEIGSAGVGEGGS